MVLLNLLDPAHRHTLARERLMLLVKDITALTLGAVAVIATLLTIGKTLLAQDLQETAERTNIVTSKHQPVQQAIRELNEELRGISLITEEYTPWSRWFSRFSSLVPPGNQITQLSINRTERTLSLRGRSRRRDDLLLLKEHMETSGLFKEIRFPLSNLLLRENIDFEFSAALDPSSLTLIAPPAP